MQRSVANQVDPPCRKYYTWRVGDFILYKISSPESLKFYIGITSQPLTRRMQRHIYDCKRLLHRMALWLRKYHSSATITTIASGLSKDSASLAEMVIIDYFSRKMKNKILNTACGGIYPPKWDDLPQSTRDRVVSRKTGKKPSIETRKKMSESRRGKRHHEQTKRKISASQKGKKINTESKAKMSAAKKGKRLSDNAVVARLAAVSTPVAILDRGSLVEFPSISAAGRYLGVNKSKIHAALKRGYIGEHLIVKI